MVLRKLLSAAVCLCALSFCAGAQTVIPVPKEKDGGSTGRITKERPGTIAMPNDMKLPPVEYRQDQDFRSKQLDDMMAERDWGSEDTAWERAKAIDTKESYQRYIAMYPYGAHRPDASQRLVDIQVDDILNGSYDNFPKIELVKEDEDSPTSTIVIENETGCPLTVFYSGEESRSIVISPGFKGSVTLPNGNYRIAASVPVYNVRPFAGSESFHGGQYKVCFVIAPVYY